jgi:hypothetical protein
LQVLYGGEKVKNGVFQAMMEVGLVNDGPVCLWKSLPDSPGRERTHFAGYLAYDRAPGHLRDQHKPTETRHRRLTRGRLMTHANSRSTLSHMAAKGQLPAQKSSSASPPPEAWSHF